MAFVVPLMSIAVLLVFYLAWGNAARDWRWSQASQP
jgi:hypothetical protein